MNPRILVVDDDDQIRRALATSLSRAGFDVTTADDGAPAIELSGSNFELVVVDYNMKTTSGVEVVRHYKERFGKGIYCAVLSGEDDETTRQSCFDAGADDVFLKPASPIELRKRLREVVALQRG